MRAFERQFIRTSRVLVLVAGAATGLSAGIIVLFQLGYWLSTGRWEPVPVSRIFNMVPPDSTIYRTASANERAQSIGAESVFTWILDTPAMAPLLIALVLLMVFYKYLSTLKETSRT